MIYLSRAMVMKSPELALLEFKVVRSALQIVHEFKLINESQRDEPASKLRKFFDRHTAIRPFLDAIYRPSEQFFLPSDETIVCRCEEVTAGEIRKIAELGCMGPNQAKAFTRCGMGPCQGRQCGGAVSAILADAHKMPIKEIGYYRARPPASPITLGQFGSIIE
jgi:hypothetical protein